MLLPLLLIAIKRMGVRQSLEHAGNDDCSVETDFRGVLRAVWESGCEGILWDVGVGIRGGG